MIPNSILKLGVALKRAYFPDVLPREAAIEEAFAEVYSRVRPFTMTSWERLYAAYQAVRYVSQNSIPGSIVECGVWKGGSSMMMAEMLRRLGDTSRSFYLFDTFAGMTEPTAKDGSAARALWTQGRASEPTSEVNAVCYSPLDEVQENMRQTRYPFDQLHFVKGPVEETIPSVIPDAIAVLRLDTDWYESTYHELTHLYPRLVRGGVLIIDDYGAWAGARRAVDDYFAQRAVKPLLGRIDPTGRLALKLDEH